MLLTFPSLIVTVVNQPVTGYTSRLFYSTIPDFPKQPHFLQKNDPLNIDRPV